MKKIAFFILIGALGFLAGCRGGGQKSNEGKEGKGGTMYGGVFRINEVEDFRSLFPLNITEVTAHRITNQVYEGLLKLNQKDLSVIACIAEKWEVNAEATSFKFFLRKGVKFHDNECFEGGEGREVTASDFKYCFNNLCSNFPDNQMFWLFKDKVKGANEYYESTTNKKPLAEGVAGVKVIDDYTLQIDLNYPFAGFLNIMAHSGLWVYPKEAFEKYGVDMRTKCVGTGAFVVKNIKEGEAVILEKNPDYWGVDKHGNKLPFLDAVKFTFLKEKKSELLEFRKGNLDMVYELPIEMIGDVVGELDDAKRGGNLPFEMQVTPAMATHYYGFQHKSELFKNPKVRAAFNYAIDRDAIVTYTLQGEGTPAIYGIVPSSFRDYEFDSLKGFTFDPAKAKELLKEGGYPNGKGFPKLTLQINSGGSNRVLLAEVIQKMLKDNLNIDVELEVLPFPQLLDNLETGKSLFWRAAWIADYPDPENFLNLLYGKLVPKEMSTKSYLNAVRYQSSVYDSLYEKALRTIDLKERYRLYRLAEQEALNDAAIMPIYYDENTRLLQRKVKNFPANALEYRDLSEVYLKEEEE